jgi:hypothetical protein
MLFASLWGCRFVSDDPKPGIIQETILSVAGLVIPESGEGSVTFTAEGTGRVRIEVDSVDLLAEPDFRVLRGDVECDADIPEEDVIIETALDRRPGEAQEGFDPPEAGDYTICFTDDNNDPGETTYRVLVTQER